MEPFSIEIHFLASRSKDYPATLDSARMFSGFTENPNVLKITDVKELFGRWEAFTQVLFNTTRWVGTEVFFRGKPLSPFKNSFFYSLQEVMQCYRQYEEGIDKTGYCSASDWGCYKLKGVGRYFNTYNNMYLRWPWFKHGHFTGSKTWTIDKNRIYEILSEEAMLNMASSCPMYDPKRIEEFVSKLPDQIVIDKHWKIEYKGDIGASGIPIGIPTGISFVEDPEPDTVPVEALLDPMEDMDAYLDKILRDREKNRKDDYSDLL